MHAADAITHLIQLAQTLGADAALVQGGGGNISVKNDAGQLYIKASGTAMKNMSRERGVVGIDAAGQVYFGQPQRPSMEWPMHVALPTRCVCHTHSVYVNVFGCMVGGDDWLHTVLVNTKYLILPYIQPGENLAAGISTAVTHYQHQQQHLPEIIILRNHGLLVAHDDTATAVTLTQMIHQRCQAALTKLIQNFESFVVYKNSTAILRPPRTYYFPDAAVFSNSAASADTRAIWAANAYIETMIRISGGTPQPLAESAVIALRAMASEQYRQQLHNQLPQSL